MTTKTTPLGSALHLAFRHPIERVFLTKLDRDRRPLLAETIEQLRPDKWPHAANLALMEVLRIAIQLLPAEQLLERSSLSMREAALLFFGQTELLGSPGSPGQVNTSFAARNKVYFSHSPEREHINERQIRRGRDALWEALAEIILRMKPPPDRSGSVTDSAPYVARPGPEQRIFEIAAAGHQVINIYGESGNGKTTLANQVSRALSSQNTSVETIRGPAPTQTHLGSRRDSPYEHDLVRLLTRAGKLPPSSSTAALEVALFELLVTGAGDIETVVLDDIDEDTARRVVPDAPQLRVVITSVPAVAVVDPASRLQLGVYNREEAAAAARIHLDESFGDQEILDLCAALANRPVAIDVACRFLVAPESTSTVADLVAACETAAAQMLDAANELSGASSTTLSLTGLYHLVLQMLQDDPRSLELLDTILWLPCGGVSEIVFAFAQEKSLTSADYYAFQSSMKRLEGLGLLTFSPGTFQMNDLTRDVLRFHRREQMAVVHSRMWSVLHKDRVLRAVKERRLPSSKDEATARCLEIRTYVAQNLHSVRAYMADLVPDAGFGAITLGGRESILWQSNQSLFTRTNGAAMWAVGVIGEAKRDLVWQSNGKRRRMSAKQTKHCGQVDTVSVNAYRVTLRMFGVTPEQTGWSSSLMSLNHERDDGLVHEVLNPLPTIDMAVEVGVVIWTSCGTLCMPDLEAPRAEQCPECAHLATLGRESLIAKLVTLMQYRDLSRRSVAEPDRSTAVLIHSAIALTCTLRVLDGFGIDAYEACLSLLDKMTASRKSIQAMRASILARYAVHNLMISEDSIAAAHLTDEIIRYLYGDAILLNPLDRLSIWWRCLIKFVLQLAPEDLLPERLASAAVRTAVQFVAEELAVVEQSGPVQHYLYWEVRDFLDGVSGEPQ